MNTGPSGGGPSQPGILPWVAEYLEPIFHVEFGDTHETDRIRIGASVRNREAGLPAARFWVGGFACTVAHAASHGPTQITGRLL